MWTEERQAEVECNLVEEVGGGTQLYHCPPDLVLNVKGRIREKQGKAIYDTSINRNM